MKEQMQLAVAPAGAVLIEQTVICDLKDDWKELEINGVAKMLHTDIALELRDEKLWLWSVKVSEGNHAGY